MEPIKATLNDNRVTATLGTGKDGQDGITPVITVTDILGGHNVAFSYGTGDPRNTSFNVMDGEDGQPGTNGTNGKDGKDGADGSDGKDGSNGSDGITPSVIVTNITGGHNVEFYYGPEDIRNANYDVLDGAAGAPGQDGQTGPAGPGVPSGGSTDQMLVKNSATNYDTKWVDQPVGVPTGGDAGQVLAKYTSEQFYTWKTVHEVPAGGTTGQLLKKTSNADYDTEWGWPASDLFVVNITGSSYYGRTSDKTPTQIKAAVDAGMMVVANIVYDDMKAYLFQSTASRAEFRSLCLQGLSNEADSMMWKTYTLNGANSTTVYINSTNITTADGLIGNVMPHVEFQIDWNDGGFIPSYNNAVLGNSDWTDFYDGLLQFHVAYLSSIYYVGQQKYTDVFVSSKIWLTYEYDEGYGGDTYIGHILFENTKLNGNTLETTEIKLKHVIWTESITMDYRTVAVNSVTTTTDYPVPYWPE